MSHKTLSNSLSVLDFWFSSEVEPFWFAKDEEFDENLRVRFKKIYQEIVTHITDGQLSNLQDPKEALALVIVLDQFSRNMFRDTPQAFATDVIALQIAKNAIQRGYDQELASVKQRNFLYMPFMHSENLIDQEEGIRFFSHIPDNDQTVMYAKHHRDIICQFGRFPHRNKILGRESTWAEIEYLKQFSGF